MSGSPTFVDLFAGLGGFRLGLEANGFSCVFGSDFSKHAADMYKLNFGEDIFSDVTKLRVEELPDFDVLCGGFPCQPFSSAGRKLGFDDTRGTLFFDVARIIDARKPRVVLLENVKNLLQHDKGNTFKVIESVLTGLGYRVTFKVLNALDFGVPQYRERIVIVASLIETGEVFDFSKVGTVPRVVLKGFLDNEEAEGVGFEWLKRNEYTLIPEERVRVQSNSGLRFVGYRNKALRVNGVREGTSYLSRAHKQPNRIYSELGSHPTLSSQERSGRYFVQVERLDGSLGVRKLTLGECYRLFGFPDSFQRCGAVGEQYARVGNSICVPMVQAVGAEIRRQFF